MNFFHRPLCQIVFASVIFLMNAQLWAEPARVSYDKSSDKISIHANDASYKDTVARIATLTGVEILMDPKAEHNVTIDVSDLPLETALKQLSRRTSFVLVHDSPEIDGEQSSAESTEPVLIRMRILPKGEFNASTAYPVLAPMGEAFIREKDRYSAPAQSVEIFNHAQRRWEARLKAMPAEKREKLVEAAQEKRERVAQNRTEREQRKKAHAEKRTVHKKRREARLEELRLSNPERYALRMKQREERQPRVEDE